MSINLPISRLIRVSVILSPLAAQAQSLNDLLILGSSDVIDVVERIRTYETIDAVATDFGTTSVEYLAAVLWFEQSPQPTQLKIGRWAMDDTKAKLIGGIVSSTNQLMASWTSISSGAFELEMNGIPYSINGLNFGTVTNMNGIASIIEDELDGAVSGTTCVWNATYTRFEIETASSGADSTISFINPPTATGYIYFSGGNPTNSDSITLNGTGIDFVSSSPTGNEVLIGSDLVHTLENLLDFLNASTDTELVKFVYFTTATHLYLKAAATGTGGNSLTIASTTGAVSGGTLAGGSGTDISTMMAAKSTSSGAYVAEGMDAETALEATVLFDSSFGQTWYALSIPEASDDDHMVVGPYIEATNNKHSYGVSTQAAGVLSSVSTTDIAYRLKQLGLKKTMVQYSSTNPYSVCSLLGRALTVNYNGNNTVITLMYKQEPGIVAESLTASQISALESKNCNVFVAYNNNTAIIEQGKVCSGDFIDTITGTDWLAVTIMTALYNLLYTSPTKIPQTDPGTHLLVVTCEAVLSQAVANGLLAPGVWNANGFGTLSQGDFLPKGFYVFAPPVATQLAADRQARKSVPIQIAAKLAGAVHTVDVSITVDR